MVDFCLSDPYGRVSPSRVSRQGALFTVEFTPKDVGPHTVELVYCGQQVPGSPFTSNAYDAARVKLTDVSKSGAVGQQMAFTGKGNIVNEELCV